MVDNMFGMYFQQQLEKSVIVKIFFNNGRNVDIIRIGSSYIDKEKVEVLPSGFCIRDGNTVKWYNFDYVINIVYYEGMI